MFHEKHSANDDPDGGVPRETDAETLSDDDAATTARLTTLLEELGEATGPATVAGLVRYGTWLRDEAIPAGALGPAEGDRIFERHVADSLMYVRGLPAVPGSVVDVGSGAGLPGIPLAIARPDSSVTILDRAARRTLLVRRAVRILGLRNVDVVTADVGDYRRRKPHPAFDAAVFRASLPIAQAAETFPTLTSPDGVGLVGVSRLHGEPDIPDPPPGVHFDLTAESSKVLDSPFWLLRMRTT